MSGAFAGRSAVKLALAARRRRQSPEPDVLGAEPIAVIGMGCRFPGGASDPERFWQLLRTGVDAITEVPAARWDAEALYDEDPGAPGKTRIRHGGFLAEVDRFDAAFFGISAREAARMDPQHRLFLEVAWEALEDAGQPAEALAGSRTGVFSGITNADYLWRQGGDLGSVELYTALGTAPTLAANRLSYQLDLRGPSLTLDSACSSSLTAVHLACRSLRSGESDLALAGGVNLMLSPLYHVAFSKGQMLAPDGRCKTFDARADGYVRGEGAGTVVLKRLSDALADGDRIWALVRGSAVNQDGLANGLTAPNGMAQEAVIREALRDATVAPEEVLYVETHGTGTPLGDPIEVEALVRAYELDRRGPGRACAIGSVKTNIGHLEAAAGMAGLIKVVLALHHGAIPPHLHFERLNPNIRFAGNPFVIPTALAPWPAGGGRRVAGLSSFGAGGSNAHLVLEQAPAEAEAAAQDEHRPILLPLSARGAAALTALARRWRESVAAENDSRRLDEVAYTAAVRRSHHRERLALVTSSRREIRRGLDAFLRAETPAAPGRGPGRRPRIAFVFSGQGAQWLGMGRELLAREPVFRDALLRCDDAFRQVADWSLADELRADAERSRLAHTEVAQPVLFALQVALSELWASWGVRPAAVVGHSSGEVAAACVAGVLGLDDAVRVIFHRGRLMQGATGLGKMATVALTAAEAEVAVREFAGRLGIAACNAPRATVLAGEAEALGDLLARLREREIFCRELRVDYAFHSPQMEPFREELERVLAGLRPAAPELPVFSTVTGERSGEASFDAAYWGRNVRRPVRFAPAIAAMLDDGFDAFLEISPHPVLAVPIAECAEERGQEVTVLASMRRGQGELAVALASLGTLYTRGWPVDWKALYPAAGRRCVALPTYPWQRQRFWLESAPAPRAAPAGSGNPFAGTPTSLAHAPADQLVTLRLDPRRPGFLDDHLVQDAVLLPGTAWIELVLANVAGSDLAAIDFRRPLSLSADAVPEIQLLTLSPAGGTPEFRIHSRRDPEGEWILHAQGELVPAEPAPAALDRRRIEALCGRCRRLAGADFYARQAARGNRWGSAFRGVTELWLGDGEAAARIEIPAEVAPEVGRYRFHPAVLDACGHLLVAVASADGERGFVLAGIDRFRLHAPPQPRMWALMTNGVEETARDWQADVRVVDEDGRPLATFEGLRLMALDALEAEPASDRRWFYELHWQPAAHPPAAESEGPGSWLLLVDAGGVGAGLGTLLENAGHRVVRVSPGDRFQRPTAADGYRIDPADPRHFERLLEEAPDPAAPSWQGVVHLGSLDADPAPSAESQGRLTGAAVHLIRALTAAALAPRLYLVTRGAQTTGRENAPPAVAQAPLWGLGRAAWGEHPELRPTLMDLDPDGDEDELAALWHEISAGEAASENQIAWRGGERLVARLRRRPQPAARDPLRLRDDAAYLVTGGLGGLGRALGLRLVERGARCLILLDRVALPPRSEWNERASDPGWAQPITAVRELEARGARVVVATVDVGDAEELAAFLEGFRQEPANPPIRGLIHAAGVMSERALADLDLGTLQAMLRPKVDGGWHLERLLAGEPLDFFVVFSSGAALLSFPLTAGYAAANAFLDALAHYRRHRGEPALAIDWGFWGEVGMAVDHRREGRDLTPPGWGAMTTAEGLEVLEALLAEDAVQIAVLQVDWQRWCRAFPTSARSPLIAALIDGDASAPDAAAAASAQSPRHALAAAPPAQRRDLAEDLLRAQVAQTLGLEADSIDWHQSLIRTGLDSLLAVELRNRLRHALGVDVPLVTFLRGCTVGELAAEVVAGIQEPAAPAAAIIPGPAAGESPLSYGQHALWIEYQLDPENWAYNALFAVRIDSPLEVAVLRRCFRRLAARHSALRTTFREIDGVPVQEVHPEPEVGFAAFAVGDRAEAERRLLEEARRPFDLTRGPVMRVVVLSRSPAEHTLLVVAHHVAVDLWSMAILLDELDVLYAAEAVGTGEEVALPEVDLDYRDYVAWQRSMLAGPEGERLEAYWREQLAGDLQALNLPFDRPRPAVRTLTGAGEFMALDPELTGRVKALAGERRTTLFTALLAAFQAFLHRLTCQDDVVVCAPMAGRNRSELTTVVGHFVNAVPLRSRLAGDPRFHDFLAGVHRTVLEALEHQDYPSSLMVQGLHRRGESSLYDIELALNAASIDSHGVAITAARPGARSRLGGMSCESIDLPQQAGQFALGLELYETGETLSGMVQYRPDLFDAATVHRLLGQFRVLLAGVAAAPGERISALPILTRAERHQLTVELPPTVARAPEAGALTRTAARVYVVDRWLGPQPLGCPGRVACATDDGSGAAPDPVTTARRLVPDPFADRPGSRLWLTHAPARLDATGRLDLLGGGEPESDPEREFDALYDEVIGELEE